MAAVKSLRGAALTPEERDAVLTYICCDNTGVISAAEFDLSVSRLREWSAQLEQQKRAGSVAPVHYRSAQRVRPRLDASAVASRR